MIKRTFALAMRPSAAFAGAAQARDQIYIVGSSTVYPFVTVVAEKFGKDGGKLVANPNKSWSSEGYPADRGRIPMPDAERKAMAKSAHTLAKLSM